MKKLLILSLVLFSGLKLFAQEAPAYSYCQISESIYKLMATEIAIEIDYGQPRKIMGDNRMRDPETGDLLVFNSMIHALNYMNGHGWEFVQAYKETKWESDSQTWYLLKKPHVEKEEEVLPED